MRSPATLEYLAALTDDVGVIQHAIEDIPNRSTGYCVDDVARALIVAVHASKYPQLEKEATRLGRIYLAYLFDAQRVDGRMRNFMGYDRTWLDEVGTEDSFGRGLWALGITARSSARQSWRSIALRIIDAAMPNIAQLTHFRARAYAALGLVQVYEATPRADIANVLRTLAADLQASFERESRSDWQWFEPFMTYDNARLCEVLIRIGLALQDSQSLELGLRALDFYAGVVIEHDVFVPIGNQVWAKRDGPRSRFDQQPIEAAGMIDATLAAFEAGGDTAYRRYAEIAYDWFFGRNLVNAPLVLDGGCRDGFAAEGVNRNMGAESTLAYLGSAFALARITPPPRKSPTLRAIRAEAIVDPLSNP